MDESQGRSAVNPFQKRSCRCGGQMLPHWGAAFWRCYECGEKVTLEEFMERMRSRG